MAKYEDILHEAYTLFESLTISEKRSSLSLVDKKYGEHITFRSQDRLHDKVNNFWDYISEKKIFFEDIDALKRTSLDTFFPLACVYIHVFSHQEAAIKKIQKHNIKLMYHELDEQ